MRVALTTLGCKVNQYDTATIETRLRGDGCDIVPFGPGADVYVINSCTVTDRADAESRQLVRRARRFNPSARVIMTGCFAQINPHGAAIPEADHVVGLNRLPDLLSAVRGELNQRIVADDLRTARQVRTLGAETFTGQTRAFLKIQEGCDLFCTFCIVPFARGRSRSVPPRTVFEQLHVLADRGFQEVVLTGVHLGGYGMDLAPQLDLVDLMEMMAAQPLIPRIRLSSIDPPEVTPRLLHLMARSEVFCPHLHIPVQAGSDPILRRMRRKYDTHFLRDLGVQIRSELPEAAIGTDVIAGFPEESEAQFEETYALLGELPLTYFHVFPYSRRTGTTAAKMPDPVSPTIIKRRALGLRKLGERKRAAFARRFVGHALRVLVEHPPVAHSGRLIGYARNYQRVEFPGCLDLANREVAVRVTSAHGALLVGELIST